MDVEYEASLNIPSAVSYQLSVYRVISLDFAKKLGDKCPYGWISQTYNAFLVFKL